MKGVRYDSSISIETRYQSIPGKCSCGCGRPLPKGRRRWASDECGRKAGTEHLIFKGHTQTIRVELFKRDKGKCARCGLFPRETGRKGEAHHVVPISRGGGNVTLDGFETLCAGRGGGCHNEETNKLRRENS